ncbi:MAG: 5'-nucleotidase C-terminal domain-containing protein, partial [Proteobacteria bacterium]|nr:5'-nucleotidase C-terminal domain-containing protein [Pseudomonadota bacterium]
KEVVATVAAGEEVSPATTLRQRYVGESALVNFIADGLVARSAEFPQGAVDLAIVNSTAVADGIPPRGPLTFQHWYGVMPFADCLQVGRLSGRQLREILDNNAKRIVRPEELAGAAPPNLKAYVSRGFLHFSAALRYAIRLGGAAREATAERITLFGAPIEDCLDRTLSVAFTNYLGAGAYGESWNGKPIGGGVPGAIPSYDLRRLDKHDLGLVFRNEIVAHIRAAGTIGAATGARLDGRLEVVA